MTDELLHSFASDNYASVHPEVLEAIGRANVGHAVAYGGDELTAEVTDLFVEHFGDDIDVAFAFNGTGANVIGLTLLLRPYQAIICAESAHINTDECGAPERMLGSKLIGLATPHGKLTPELLDDVNRHVGSEHQVQPKVVSITQSTEVGTAYTVDEIQALAEWVHSRDMMLHMDGARLANAAATLGVGLGELGGRAGVDVLTFGATKNGAMGAEAVVVFCPPENLPIKFVRKQSMQLSSKMRYVAAQFQAILSNDLWLRNARHANAMARRLADGLVGVPGIELVHPVQANGVFARMPRRVIDALQVDYRFYVWDEATDTVRWMAAFDTTEADIDGFLASIRRHAGT